MSTRSMGLNFLPCLFRPVKMIFNVLAIGIYLQSCLDIKTLDEKCNHMMSHPRQVGLGTRNIKNTQRIPMDTRSMLILRDQGVF